MGLSYMPQERKTFKQILDDLYAHPGIPFSHKPYRPNDAIEGQIWLVANPEAAWKEVAGASHRYGRDRTAFRLFDGGGKPVFTFPEYLTDLSEVIEFKRQVASDLILGLVIRENDLLEVTGIIAPFGLVEAAIPVLPAPHALLIAIFEYLLAKWRSEHVSRPKRARGKSPRVVPEGGIL